VAALNEIVYLNALSGPAGAVLENDSANPINIDLTWELEAA
jgi:hypothetical protein